MIVRDSIRISSPIALRITLVATTSTLKSRETFFILSGLVLITACLYWSRQVLIPVALAILLAFILTPAVSALQRRGLGRLPSVFVVVILALLLLGGVGYVISRQIDNLVGNLQNYVDNIVTKFESLQGAGEGGFFGRIQHTAGEISDKLTQNEVRKAEKKLQENGKEKPQPGETPAIPLYVQLASSGWSRVGEVLGPTAEGLADSFLVLVLVVFMLIQRENLRNRMVRLFGHGRLIATTQAFDEGAQRISRYLLMQLFINTIFGVTLGVGLFVAGLWSGERVLWQYALLWGFLSGVLRFIPYIGTWVAAALITGFSLATLPGWYLPLGIFAFFIVVELLTANVVEPLLFGHSTGISPMALLLAAAFWTRLWGPVGLILSTPLTVILVVLGKYVPELHFFEVLLGDEPALKPYITYYQRLVARDLDEASDLVEEFAGEHPEEVYEEVMLPALLLAKKDRERGELDADNYQFVLKGMRDVLEDLASAQVKTTEGQKADTKAEASTVVFLGCPGRDEADELALDMLARVLRHAGYAMEVLTSAVLSAEVMDRIQGECPAVICIGSLPPGGLAQARYLCKRIRLQCPKVKIVVGRWGEKDNVERMEKRLHDVGADYVGTTLTDSRKQIIPLLQVAANTTPAATNPAELVTTH